MRIGSRAHVPPRRPDRHARRAPPAGRGGAGACRDHRRYAHAGLARSRQPSRCHHADILHAVRERVHAARARPRRPPAARPDRQPGGGGALQRGPVPGRHLAGGQPFMTLPTACIPAPATVDATDTDNASSSRTTAPFTPTNCGAVPFEPAASVQPETTRRGTPSGYTVALTLPSGETPVRQAHVRRTVVVLPEGTTLSPGVAGGGLEACAAT